MPDTSTKLLLCGEGPSDFGAEDRPLFGPLAEITFRLLETISGEEGWRTCSRCVSLPRMQRANAETPKDNERRGLNMSFVPPQDAPHYDACFNFAKLCGQEYAMGIFHSDADFTSEDNGERVHTLMRESLQRAIHLAGADDICCCALPKPRSESWFMILAPECTYSPAAIEAMPGNDSSPKSQKKILAEWGYSANMTPTLQLVDEHYDLNKLMTLPSFQNFRQGLEHVFNAYYNGEYS